MSDDKPYRRRVADAYHNTDPSELAWYILWGALWLIVGNMTAHGWSI